MSELARIIQDSLVVRITWGSARHVPRRDSYHLRDWPRLGVWQVVSGTLIVETEHGARHELSAGMLHIETPQDGGCTRWVDRTRSARRGASFTAMVLGGIPLERFLAFPTVVNRPEADRLATVAVEAAAPVTNYLGAARRHRLAFTLVEHLLRLATPRPSAAAFSDQRLVDVLQHIDRHLDRPIGRGELARLIGVRDSRLGQIFRAALGESPLGWLRHRRIARAQELLTSETSSITDIAARVGFADPFHFSRVFRRATGHSPLEWRRRWHDG
jgi:AraC-like DNA-binding protein